MRVVSMGIVASLVLAACGSPGPGRERTTHPRGGGAPVGQKSELAEGPLAIPGGPDAVSCDARSSLDPAALALRDDGLAQLDDNRLQEAVARFEQVLDSRPGNHAAQLLIDSVHGALTAVQADAAAALERVSVKRLRRPPMQHTVERPVRLPAPLTPPRLALRGRTANKVVDTDEWYARHGLRLPLMGPALDQIPAHIPTKLHGQFLSHAIDHGSHRVLVYGGRMVVPVAADGAVIGVFDLESFAETRGQQVKWAMLAAGALLVMNANPLYARDSNNENAHITAIDPSDGSLMWRSQPLVGNGQNFLVVGSHVITGYGFTAEPDYLYALSLATGEVETKLALTTSPEVILQKQGLLQIRGYDADFVVDPGITDAAPAPAARAPLGALLLAPASVQLPPIDAADRCRRARSLAMLDQGRLEDAERELVALGRTYRRHPMARALLDGVGKAVRDRRIDLSASPIVLARPPFGATVVRELAVPSAPAPRLVVLRSGPSAEALPDWLARHGLPQKEQTQPGSVFDRGPLAPPSVPTRLGREGIRRVLAHGDHMALIYGGRFLAIVEAGRASAIYDFLAYLEPPKKSDDLFGRDAQLELVWAEKREGIVYASHTTGTYASAVLGKQAYLTALDATTGALMWRSQPLVSGTGFAIVGSHIVTGYGFTAEADHLFVLDRRNGNVASRVPVANAPFVILAKDRKVFVRTFDNDYELELR